MVHRQIIIFCVAVLFLRCQKDIGFKNIDSSYDPDIFIEGILYPGEIPSIYVSNSLPFIHERVSPQEIFIREADVEISGTDYYEQLVPDSTFDKFRCRWNPFYSGNIPIEYGKTYALKVTVGEEVFTASTTIDQPQVNIASVEYTPEFYDVYGGHDGVIIRLDDIAGMPNNYRFQMDRWIDNTRLHAHVLDVISSTCTEESELFHVTDLGRTIYSDGRLDGEQLEMYIEVSFEYLQGDTATIYMQSLDEASAAFFRDIDEQLQSILNPFVEPVFLHSTIEGTLGVFGSAVRSEPITFVYPQDNP